MPPMMQPGAILLNIALFLSLCFPSVSFTERLLGNANPSPKSCDSDECKVKGNDCTHIKKLFTNASSGVYVIQPIGNSKSFKVFCDMEDGGGWTVFQIRNGLNSLNFHKGWAEYKKGFGHTCCEHWLGLENIYSLTNQANKRFKLRVDLKDFEDGSAYAEYSDFWIDSETEFYRLHLGNYSGNAGDAFRGRGSGTPEEDQNSHMFSTYDRDNDDCKPCLFGDIIIESCSGMHGSGWWFSQCGIANLNGDWHPKNNNIGWMSGVHWKTWKEVSYSMRVSQLKVVSV
ncbi:angiopoietin-related protein 5-like [Scyliorhinus canicula]|uniref:angiopoietin-related protein 5-like n=1 Tax=Scyliorhinus canicula TaxID=7830 RepID=UPI0018F760DA|nr:angiopoietin-related protein 5-like [Scyliorhinus canicula]XP_038667383.1 angiopoietin-related protein 5-like [Scyliorhinus canicula]XP_038667384.1 angiopoietin-related protein 5-like [Scyliorhinus canicula]